MDQSILRTSIYPKFWITEGCKNIKNRKPNHSSELPSARGRRFAQPIAYNFTHLSTANVHKNCTAPELAPEEADRGGRMGCRIDGQTGARAGSGGGEGVGRTKEGRKRRRRRQQSTALFVESAEAVAVAGRTMAVELPYQLGLLSEGEGGRP